MYILFLLYFILHFKRKALFVNYIKTKKMENLMILFESTIVQYLLFIITILVSVLKFGGKKIFLFIKLLLLVSLFCYFITHSSVILLIICSIFTILGLIIRFILNTINIMDEDDANRHKVH